MHGKQHKDQFISADKQKSDIEWNR